jgi:hypothetical protein
MQACSSFAGGCRRTGGVHELLRGGLLARSRDGTRVLLRTAKSSSRSITRPRVCVQMRVQVRLRRPPLPQLVATMNGTFCSAFLHLAARFSSLARTVNPRGAGSSPARPMLIGYLQGFLTMDLLRLPTRVRTGRSERLELVAPRHGCLRLVAVRAMGSSVPSMVSASRASDSSSTAAEDWSADDGRTSSRTSRE